MTELQCSESAASFCAPTRLGGAAAASCSFLTGDPSLRVYPVKEQSCLMCSHCQSMAVEFHNRCNQVREGKKERRFANSRCPRRTLTLFIKLREYIEPIHLPAAPTRKLRQNREIIYNRGHSDRVWPWSIHIGRESWNEKPSKTNCHRHQRAACD